jgi:hypothetical protein
MNFHGRLYDAAARDFDDVLVPGFDDLSFSFHYLHIVFEDEKKNSDLICSNREQIGHATIQCDFMRRRDLTATRVGQRHADVDAESLCHLPGRATLTKDFIQGQQACEEHVFKSYANNGYCSLLIDAGKMHRSPYLCICICNPSTDLDPLVILGVKGLNGTVKDYQEVAMDAFIKCKRYRVQIVGALNDHLKARVSALAHYSDQSVFKRYEKMEAKGLRFFGCACHKLNLAVKDFLSDHVAVIAAPIFGDISTQVLLLLKHLPRTLRNCPKS